MSGGLILKCMIEKISVALSRLLVEMWMFKALLSAQKEMRSLLMETGESRFWFYNIVAESLAELCPEVLWKKELVSDQLEDLAENISIQCAEGASWFLLAAYDKIREEILSVDCSFSA